MAAQSVPSAGEHVSDVLASLSGDLDALAAVDLHDLPVAALPELLESLTVLQRRLDAQVLATVETFDAAGAWQRDGAASARAWMRANLRQSPGVARSAVVTARRLRDLPAMETALRAGEISREHVAVVTRAMEASPARRDTIAAAETVFAEAAKDLDPNQLARAVTRWTHIVDPLGALEAEKAIHAQRFLSASRTFEGAVKIDGLLGPEQGATVMTALEAMSTADYRQTRSERGEPVDSDGGDRGGGAGDGGVEGLTAGQRRADALVELSRRFLDSGEAPEIAGMRPHLHLTVPLETLAAEPATPGGADAAELEPAQLDGVGPISAEAARRIGCEAILGVMGLDAVGMPLTYGRTRRTVDSRLRKVLNERDGGCRFPSCDRPVTWCEAHHVVHWAHGGPTDPCNLVLLCLFHHHACHEGGFTIRGTPVEGRFTFHRPDGTLVADRGRDPTHRLRN